MSKYTGFSLVRDRRKIQVAKRSSYEPVIAIPLKQASYSIFDVRQGPNVRHTEIS
jgi:hypothetical protein